MAELHIRLLGPFAARAADGTPLSLPTRKALGLLAYLALPAGRWHSREQVAGLLWGRSGEEQARSSLRQTLSGLRRALAERDADVILCQGENLALDPAGLDSDLGRFEALAGETSPAPLADARALYTGELLEGFSLREETFEEWLEVERRRLREIAVGAMARELEYHLSAADAEQGVAVAGRLLELEPLREDVHRALMRLYAQMGRRGAAVQQYEHCREILRRELGIGPEPETERLASEIRAQPRTEYARCGDIDIAYQVLGQGPIDLVYIPGWVSHLEYGWEYPGYARFLRRLAAFSRLIVFDKRGTGLSEREVGYPTLEERMDDLRAVLDAVGSRQAALLAVSEGGSLACLFAASNPGRTSALILHGCFAKRMRSQDYPWGFDDAQFNHWLGGIDDDWGGRMALTQLAPSIDIDSDFYDWFSKFLRYSASRQAALKLTRLNAKIDVRHVLPAIHVPTLVTRRRGDLVASEGDTRFLADHIDGARLVELPGDEHAPFIGDIDGLADVIEEFLTGVRHEPASERVLLTIVCISLAPTPEPPGDPAGVSAATGRDAAEGLIRTEVGRHQGRSVIDSGDGLVLAFDGPQRAVACTGVLRARLGGRDAGFRAGMHVGECEVRGEHVSGSAVGIAAAIMNHAGEDQIVASRTVKDLTVGAGIMFETMGEIALEGAAGTWQLFSVGVPADQVAPPGT